MASNLLLLFVFILGYCFVEAEITCDFYLNSTCVVNSTQISTEKLTIIQQENLFITEQGKISCSPIQCTLIIITEQNITIHGYISAGTINITADSVIVSSSGILNTSAQGYSPGEGPGAGYSNQGASYGGWSSYASCESPSTNKNVYGSAIAPSSYGSGGSGNANTSSWGGGIVFIRCSSLEINGAIYANGGNGTVSENITTSGGSGGSVLLSAIYIIGNGSISANGGSAAPTTNITSSAGGGSGGRISLPGIPATLKISAAGGWSGDQCSCGGYGTIYDSNLQTLYINGNGEDIESTGLSVIPSDEIFSNIVVTNYAQVYVTGVTCNNLEVSTSSVVTGDIYNLTAASLVISSSFIIDGTSEVSFPNQTISIVTGNLTVAGELQAQAISIVALNLTVSGAISADENGFPANFGPGAGTNGSGASYGGYASSCNPKNNSVPYGNLFEPKDFGSGGGNYLTWTGGAGGGSINIITDFLFLTGSINADGGQGQASAGGGSGGSIVLNAQTAVGSGLITANGGGTQVGNGGLGSGGRIAIYSDSFSPNIHISAYGKASSSCDTQAGAGTIYFAQNDTLVISNSDFPSSTRPSGTIVNGMTPVSKTVISSIIVTNFAVLLTSDYIINTTSLTLRSSTISCGPCASPGTVVTSSIVIDSSSQLILDKWWDFTATNNFTLNGIILGSGLIFNVGNFMNISGGINTDGRGFGPALGPGAGASGTADSPGGGAGHGSNGMSSCGSATGGESYDIPNNPTVPGSGGGNSGTLVGGAGGGAILIKAKVFSLSGFLTANGLAGAGGANLQTLESNEILDDAAALTGAGGGSGGAISLTASSITLMTSAYVSANGGNGGIGTLSGGGGAGGCVFMGANDTQVSSGNVNVSAIGGTTGCKTYVNNGTMVSKCPTGFSAVNIFQCQPCATGYYSNDGYKCNPCSPGSSTNGLTGQSTCAACAPGYAAHNPASSNCTPCARGFFANASGTVQCTACNPGTVAQNTGASVCTPCPAGQFYNGFGGYTCNLCSTNTYNNKTGQPNCTTCPFGYVSYSNSTSCSPCGPGTIATYWGYCSSCSSGTYSNLTANEYCYPCPAGTYQYYSGRSTCSPCGLGQYSYSGSSLCLYCSSGQFANKTGSTSCTYCPPYTYQPNTGAWSCYDCPTARYSGSYSCYTYNSSDEGSSGLTIFFTVMGSFTFLVSVGVLCCVCCSRRERTNYQAIPANSNNLRPQNANRPLPPSSSLPTRPQYPLPPIPPARNDAILDTNSNNPNAEDASKQECIICCDTRRETVMLPCGHITACEKCTRALISTNPKCPICRNIVVSFVRMYSA